MNIGKFRGSILACLALAAVLTISASASAVTAKSDSRVLKIVETQDVDFATAIPLPTPEDMAAFLAANPEIADALLELLGEDCLEQAAWFLDTVGSVDIDVDGKIHINLMAWVNEDAADIKLHASWHGTIVVTLNEREGPGSLEIALDLKNVQLMTHTTVICESPYVVDLKMNAHANGEAATDGIAGLDISFHIFLKISDGELQMLKIWVPSWLDAILAEI